MAGTTAELIHEGRDITEYLTDPERERLEACEGIIQNGLGTFIEVGRALAEIRDYRLYRATHKTFEGYCRDVFDISRGRAYQQISGYEIVMRLKKQSHQLLTFSDTEVANKSQVDFQNLRLDNDEQERILPLNEAQTRPLTRLSPENQFRAWDLVLEQLNEGKKLTAALIKKAARDVRGEVAKKTITTAVKNMENAQRVSNLFKKQYQLMLNIISEEKNNQWKNCKKTEVIRYLKELIKVVENDD